ncbi:hypothetical protein [Joostella sp. CR20]|uniref:hypothetical protein n=1 Tax=Joostella sp. CR20 TaxID=2804312 RepID=UPI00313DEC23
MKLLKKVFDFYLNSSIHVALAVYALVRVTMYNFGIAYDEAISYALFFGTIVEYSFIKYSSLAKHYLFVRDKYLGTIQFFSGICLLIAFYYIVQLRFQTIIVAAILVLLAFLYVVPAVSSKRNFRSLKGVKIYIVGITWSVSTVLLPIINNEIEFTTDIYVALLQRFVYVIILMIPFEIRDLTTDEDWLRTLPQVLGIKKVKILGVLLVGLFLVLGSIVNEVLSYSFIVEVVVAIFSLVALLLAKKKQSPYFASFFVEGISILWWCLLSYGLG